MAYSAGIEGRSIRSQIPILLPQPFFNGVTKLMRILTWAYAAISAAVIWEVVDYIRASDSNHTAFEPWLLVAVFIPTIVFGAVVISRRQFVAGVVAISIGASGLALLTYIDRTNTMVQYDRWLSRGMPLPHEPSRHENIH